MSRKKISISEAAAAMGRKGGKASGACKARKGTSAQIKAWWASPDSIPWRKKLPPVETAAEILENPTGVKEP